MAELADAQVSDSCGYCFLVGSSPIVRTKNTIGTFVPIVFFVWDLNPLKHLIRQCLCVATFPSRVRHKITPQVFGLWGLFYLFFCCSYFFCCFYWNFGDCFKFFLFLTLFIFCYESVAGCDKTRENKQDKKYCRKCAY